MGRFFAIKILLRILLICGLGIATVFLFLHGFNFTAVFCLLVSIILLLEFYQFLLKPLQDVHKTLSSMLNEDFSLKSPSSHRDPIFVDLGNLYKKQKQSYFEQESVQLIYNNILNSISTGIFILRKTQENEWEIFMMNRTFAKVLQIPVYASWNNFQRNVPEFVERLNQIEFGEVRQTLEISVDNQENQTYSLKTSTIKTYSYLYFIVSIDSVQSIIEKKEKQAWHDLMKVISHEMMNTLTPINSLVSSLQYFAEQDEWSNEDKNDFKESLETIQKKTVHMLEFVDNYRKLTNLPQPNKKKMNLILIVQSCIEMMKSMLDENQIRVKTEYEKEEIFYSVDLVLTERVLINLLTNSIYAVQNNKGSKEILIRVYTQNHRIFIEVQDNGHGIDKEIRDKVFIPFFTTRENGAGIGLALSKNIMEAQNGHLTFKSKPEKTVFIMSFL